LTHSQGRQPVARRVISYCRVPGQIHVATLAAALGDRFMAFPPEMPAMSASGMSLVDSVYETLLEAILNGRLAKGAQLNVALLARQLQVSRTPVQGAIRRLESDGLAIQQPGRKARVTEFTVDDLREFYALRMLLEPEAAALAVERISDDTLRSLADVGKELLAATPAPDWVQRAIEYDIRFHRAIAEASGNGRLRDAVLHYRLLVLGSCRRIGNFETRRQAFREQQAVLAALLARDAQAARMAMRDHIAQRLAVVVGGLTASASPGTHSPAIEQSPPTG
jgi:DNA-binding GntR family transcriptional regulator